MTFLLTRCFLIVPLVLALMIRAESFTIRSVKNNLFISNHSVAIGENIRLGLRKAFAVHLEIDPPVDPATFDNHTIFDDNAGLYVGAEEPLSAGTKLTWVTEPYHWIILKTTKNTYVAFPPGQNYFWYDGNSAGSTTGTIKLVQSQENVELDGIEWDIVPS